MDRLSSLKTRFLQRLLHLGRLSFFRPLFTFLFNHMDAFLPVDPCYENTHWVAIHHPQPEYPLHILILPKGSLPSLTSAPLDEGLYADFFMAVQTLVAKYQLETRGYRLITNGGPYQTIPQWHWHLISEKAN